MKGGLAVPSPGRTAAAYFGRFLLLAIILLVHFSLDVKHGLPYRTGFGVVLTTTLIAKRWDLLHLSLLLFVMSISGVLFPGAVASIPSFKFLMSLVISTAVVLLFPGGRVSLWWARRGHIDRVSVVLIVVTGIVSSGALLLWAFQADNLGSGIDMVRKFARFPKLLVFAVGVPFFALVNALAEEIVFRGVMQAALSAAFQRRYLVVILQASAFAAFHFAAGFPNGYTGYAMAFIYGLMMGYLRERTQGLLAPYCAHVAADLTIGYFLCIYAL
jgi:membrane protease YdiL (CAAX protease family)